MRIGTCTNVVMPGTTNSGLCHVNCQRRCKNLPDGGVKVGHCGGQHKAVTGGVKVDILSAGCFGVGDERTGCTDPAEPWRFDPMHAPNGFQVDNNNAHAQPDGAYHYHGPPPISSGGENTASGLIGYAVDGFPIYGPYFDDNGTIRTASSSFQLKSGTPPSGEGEPGGTYDGQFRADYEYVSGIGDLDECNGMTLDGQYRYHMTAEFPYMISCFSGAPDPSFFK